MKILDVIGPFVFVGVIIAGVFAMKFLFDLLDYILYGC